MPNGGPPAPDPAARDRGASGARPVSSGAGLVSSGFGPASSDAGLVRDWTRTGTWLFRRRSYLPLVVLAFLAALSYAAAPADTGRLDRWETAGLLVCLAGLALRLWTVGHAPAGTSGRGTRRLEAASLSTEGVYSMVRHPLYLGNCLLWCGVAATTGSPGAVVITLLVFWIYTDRIMLAEERFLHGRFGPEFARWAERTPALVPAPRRWRPHRLPFSLRFALGRDHAAIYAWVAASTALEAAESLGAGRGLELAPFWRVYFAMGTVAYLVLWRLKKDTAVLSVEGR